VRRRVRIECDIFLAILLTLFLTASIEIKTSEVKLKIEFGETYKEMNGEVAQLFYSENQEELSEEKSQRKTIADGYVTFQLPEVELSNTQLRFEPVMSAGDFTIHKVEVLLRDRCIWSLSGEEITDYIEYTVNCEYDWNEGKFISCSDDPMIWLNSKFNETAVKACQKRNMTLCFVSALILYLGFGILQIKIKRKEYSMRLTKGHFAGVLVSGTVVAVGISLNYGVFYMEQNFGDTPFGQLLYHLHTPLDGTNTSSFYGIFGAIAAIWVITFAAVFGVDYLLRRFRKQAGYPVWLGLLGIIIGAYALIEGYLHFEYGEYYKYTHENTELYEQYYVDGRNVTLKFPEKKRNLIYIFLESMETTYADERSGGAMQKNYIPELTELSMENISFSENGVLNGAYTVPGATFTMGALVAQTSGVPINETLVSNSTLNGIWESENNYLPGIWSIGDVLAEEGYVQEFMIGSDASFAGRGSYFRGHGDYKIFDYYKALSEGKIPEGYWVWWGYEDKKLIDFAKEELLSLAEGEEPFNFTMLTVDTHFTDGYECEKCGKEYDSQYSNVIACSDSQIAAFVRWIMQQEFYENTTIVIAGDHLTMDSAYIQSEGAEAFDRKTYFTMINPAEGSAEAVRERRYTTLDIYPTTLAGLGVEIEGDRLGLGVNLFSDTPTLYEEFGAEYLNEELLKNSKFYTKKLLYGN